MSTVTVLYPAIVYRSIVSIEKKKSWVGYRKESKKGCGQMNTNQGVSIGVDLFLDCPHQHLKAQDY